MDRTIIRNFNNFTWRDFWGILAAMMVILTLFYSLLYALGVDLKPKQREGCAAHNEQTQNFC